MTNFNHLKEQIHQQVEKYDSAHDDNQRRMAARKLLVILDENHQAIQEIMPDFQKFYLELHYCCYQKSAIYNFMSKNIPTFVSNDMSKFISNCMDAPISETLSKTLSEAMADAMSRFLPSVVSKMIHHFWEQFDQATN